MGEDKVRRTVEASLFMSAKPMGLDELAKIAGVSAPGFVENELKELQKEYVSRGSAIEVALENGQYYMRIRSEFADRVSVLAGGADLSRGALRVLALISKSECMEQSQLV